MKLLLHPLGGQSVGFPPAAGAIISEDDEKRQKIISDDDEEEAEDPLQHGLPPTAGAIILEDYARKRRRHTRSLHHGLLPSLPLTLHHPAEWRLTGGMRKERSIPADTSRFPPLLR